MQTLIFTLSLTSALLLIGITGTLIGITRLVYPSSRRYSPKRDKNTRSRARRATRET
jgi:hypothetical protein